MQDAQRQNLRAALATLARTHALLVEQLEQMIQLLSLVLEADEPVRLDNQNVKRIDHHDVPAVDRSTLSVRWRGNTCFFGNTLPFLFIERLARDANSYVPYDDLLDEIWGGPREKSTIRGIAKRVRDHLVECGMNDLAEAIDGTVSGHYGLMLV